MSDPEDDEATDLLTSPLQSTGVGKLFVIGGPAGLAIAICLSLWASWMHVRHSIVVQVEPQWVASERLAVRAQLVSQTLAKVADLDAQAWVEQGGQRYPLPSPRPVSEPDLVQTGFVVPELSPGPAQLHVTLQAKDTDLYEEAIDIEVVGHRKPKPGTRTVSASTLQHGDDSDAQLQPIRIDIRPDGGVHSEFVNRFYVRVLHPDGRPYPGQVEVALAYGGLAGHKGDPEKPVSLVRKATNALGVVAVEGRLTSEVLRLEARVLADDGSVRFKRRMRFVSFAGAVEINAAPDHVAPAASLGVEAHGLTARRPVFVDVHDASGAWIDTLTPFEELEEPRPWEHPSLLPGVLQFEAYLFTGDPGESTALARVQVVDGDPAAPQSLKGLIAAYRARLDAPRVELDYDPQLDAAYLDWLEAAPLQPAEVRAARAWLLGTLPIEVYGPPTILNTHERDLLAVAERQRWWTIWLRWFLLGGGGLFLVAMAVAMVHSHGQAARKTMAELALLTEGEARAEAALAVQQAKRQALVRGLGVLAVMAAALILTTILLEKLLWVF